MVKRFKLFGLFVLCLVTTPLLFFAMFVQIIIGTEDRAKSVALAYDKCGNLALGGTRGLSVSAQVGNALKLEKPWAIRLAFLIDLLMGKDHCLNSAST
jgi:hypothetical protein